MLRVGNGFANTDSPIQHFGIGLDESIERIVITWPSGVVQTIHEPPLYQVIEVLETPPCQGDADGDGVVNVVDVLAVLGAWGPCPGAACAADFDGNGLIDVLDFLAILQNWGPCAQ
jgi:hypothetical protein